MFHECINVTFYSASACFKYATHQKQRAILKKITQFHNGKRSFSSFPSDDLRWKFRCTVNNEIAKNIIKCIMCFFCANNLSCQSMYIILQQQYIDRMPFSSTCVRFALFVFCRLRLSLDNLKSWGMRNGK